MKQLIILLTITSAIFIACTSEEEERQLKVSRLTSKVENLLYYSFGNITDNRTNRGVYGIELPQPIDSLAFIKDSSYIKEVDRIMKEQWKDEKIRLIEATKYLNEIIVLDKTSIWAYRYKIMVFNRMGLYDSAYAESIKMEQLWGDTLAETNFQKAYSLDKSGKREKAEACYMLADSILINQIEKNPTDTNSLTNYIRQGYIKEGKTEVNMRLKEMQSKYPSMASYLEKFVFSVYK